MSETKLCPPFFHYPEDRSRLLALAAKILGQTDGWESEEARLLASLVEAILQDEDWMFKNAPELIEGEQESPPADKAEGHVKSVADANGNLSWERRG